MKWAKEVSRTSSGLCGCAYCLKVYKIEEIVEWVDAGKTAICPKCSIDSVYELEDFNSKGILRHLNASLFSVAKRGYDQDKLGIEEVHKKPI